MRTIGVVTVARSDFGIYRPLLRALQAEPTLKLRLLVSGGHLRRDQGLTVREVAAEFPVAAKIPVSLPSDDPEGIALATGSAVSGFARALAARRPDLLVVLGDRYEMFAAAVAALPLRIPVAHLHGGELTRGAIDDALRHSLTKLSHLHFVAAPEYGHRVRQLGEEPWRVVVSGAPGLDNLREERSVPPEEFRARWGIDVRRPFLLATFHPVTLQYGEAEAQAGEFVEGLRASGLPAVFTLPNADTRGRRVARVLREFARSRPDDRFVESLGTRGYFGLMRHAAAMVGNSSSGLVEAPSFRLPVVNVGIRQEGRLRARNVIDVPCERGAILRALRRATHPRFRASLAGLRNPYQASRPAAEIIVRTLKGVPLGEKLLLKRFVDR